MSYVFIQALRAFRRASLRAAGWGLQAADCRLHRDLLDCSCVGCSSEAIGTAPGPLHSPCTYPCNRGTKRGLLQEGSPEALQLLSHVKRNNAIPEKKCLWLAREAFFLFENLDLNRCALGCARGPVHPSLDPIWAPKGCDQEFRASRGPLWAVHPIQKGPPGRPFGRPEVAPEGLGAILEMLKKR